MQQARHRTPWRANFLSAMELLAQASARLLTFELFAVGFRWCGRPRHAERGLWHPKLEIGIDISETRAAPSIAEPPNTLVVVLDLDPSLSRDEASLKVIAIEDLIVQQVG